ncbi:hypothetical protein LEM8419_03565 [Neolewinella maritima]|uniref:Peptidase M12A domain-containing protein n=1 Tax=Neolewinella maritima TaxID=1383882 RepID=A0ABN8F7X9_9BACT|nr:M12 family metallopeptidase [Neolewinella maritima]CAH1002693.1 hypothetical protein LEM8419_03565 [Neolewinella maritima]
MSEHFCCIASPKTNPNIQRAVGVRGKYWKPGQSIRIAFVGGDEAQRAFVRRHCVAWTEFANLTFVFTPDASIAEVRIAFNEGQGSRSYLGRDALNIPVQYETMNFGWLDEAVVLHEFGHMLGLAHEHQNPNEPIQWDKDRVYADLSQAPNYWDKATIDHNIFKAYELGAVDSSPLDKDSIMLYQVPSRWTLNGFSAGFNTALSEVDKAFVARIYPGKTSGLTVDLEGVFTRRKDIAKLPERVVVALGERLRLPVDVALLKRENVDMVAAALGVG